MTQFGNVHTHFKSGKLAKRLGWPSIYSVTLELGNGLLTYGKTLQGKDKIALNEGSNFGAFRVTVFSAQVICRYHNIP